MGMKELDHDQLKKKEEEEDKIPEGYGDAAGLIRNRDAQIFDAHIEAQ